MAVKTVTVDPAPEHPQGALIMNDDALMTEEDQDRLKAACTIMVRWVDEVAPGMFGLWSDRPKELEAAIEVMRDVLDMRLQCCSQCGWSGYDFHACQAGLE